MGCNIGIIITKVWVDVIDVNARLLSKRAFVDRVNFGG